VNVVNKSDYDTQDVKRLVRRVMSTLKKSFTIPPLETIRFESYDGKTWSGQYRGGKTIIIRVGRKVRFPNTWDRIIELPNWEDLFVGLLCWCVCLHYQKACWARKNPGQQTKYRRTDCQEITTRMIRRWRVDDSYNLILEKADAD
jgi:hypothetical protein